VTRCLIGGPPPKPGDRVDGVALDLHGYRGVRPDRELRVDCGSDLVGDHGNVTLGLKSPK